MNEKDDITVKARKSIDELWKNADLRGRCWGVKKKDGNCFRGTNITIGYGDEIVSVSERDGKLVVHEFVRARSTTLGQKVKKLLKEKSLI